MPAPRRRSPPPARGLEKLLAHWARARASRRCRRRRGGCSGVEETPVVGVDRGEEDDRCKEYQSLLAQAAAAGGGHLLTRGASVRQLVPPVLIPLQGARRRLQVVVVRLPLRPVVLAAGAPAVAPELVWCGPHLDRRGRRSQSRCRRRADKRQRARAEVRKHGGRDRAGEQRRAGAGHRFEPGAS